MAMEPGRIAREVLTRSFFDTNVLVYLFDEDSPKKKARAQVVLEQESEAGRAVLSTQVFLPLIALRIGQFTSAPSVFKRPVQIPLAVVGSTPFEIRTSGQIGHLFVRGRLHKHLPKVLPREKRHVGLSGHACRPTFQTDFPAHHGDELIECGPRPVRDGQRRVPAFIPDTQGDALLVTPCHDTAVHIPNGPCHPTCIVRK